MSSKYEPVQIRNIGEKWHTSQLAVMHATSHCFMLTDFWGFKSQYQRWLWVEGSAKFDHVGFFNVHRHHTVQGLQCFASTEMQPLEPGFDPTCLGSAAEYHSYKTTVVGPVFHDLTGSYFEQCVPSEPDLPELATQACTGCCHYYYIICMTLFVLHQTRKLAKPMCNAWQTLSSENMVLDPFQAYNQ